MFFSDSSTQESWSSATELGPGIHLLAQLVPGGLNPGQLQAMCFQIVSPYTVLLALPGCLVEPEVTGFLVFTEATLFSDTCLCAPERVVDFQCGL